MKSNNLFKILRGAVATMFLPVLCLGNEVGSGLCYKPQPFDVQNYAIEAEIPNPSDKCVRGVSKIDVKLLHESPDDRFFFHLFDLNVDSCVIKGVSVLPAMDTDSLGTQYYALPIGNYTEDSIRINIYYSGTMTSEGGDADWGGVHYKDSILFNLGPGFNKPNVSGAGHWFPCYDHPSDKATYSVQMTFPEDLTLASAGFEQFEESAGDGLKTVKWKHDFPASTYMMGFAIGRFEKIVIENTGSVPNVIYSRADKVKDATGGLRLLGKMLDCFTSYFGAYPFDKVGYVVTPVGSMEHQSMIAVAKGALLSTDTLSDNPAHELAHAWFGGCVSPLDFSSVWLKEGFASYCETLWRGYATENVDNYFRRLRVFAQYYHGMIATEGALPLHDFPRYTEGSELPKNYPNTIYKKGAVVVGQLRYFLGDSLFFKGVNYYLDKYRYKNANTQMFKKALEESSGRDLTEFFDMWVYGIGHPIMNVNIEELPYEDNQYKKCVFTLSQTQAKSWGSYKDFPLEVNFKLSDGTYLNKIINVTDVMQIAELDSIPVDAKVMYNLGKIAGSPVKLDKTSISGADELVISNNSVAVYPNPVSDGIVNFVLDCGEIKSSEIKVEIYSVLGDLVLENSLPVNSDNRYSMNIGNMPSGAYLLSVTENGGSITSTIVNVVK